MNTCDGFLKDGEKLDDLQLDGLKIIQNSNLYRFTSDAVILANFIRAKPKDFLIDLGTGSGIIAILATHKNRLKNVLGVEFQNELADMAKRSVKLNKLEDIIKIVNCDIKNLKVYSSKYENYLNFKNDLFFDLFFVTNMVKFQTDLDITAVQKIKNTKLFLKKKADVIVCNPPYKKLERRSQQIEIFKEKTIFLDKCKDETKQTENEIEQTENETKQLERHKIDSKFFARHEIGIEMEELIEIVSSILKYGGKFYVVYDSNRFAELIFKLKKYGLEPKRILFTQPNAKSNAILVFIEAVKGGKEGIKILPNLITNDIDGKYLESLKELKFDFKIKS